MDVNELNAVMSARNLKSHSDPPKPFISNSTEPADNLSSSPTKPSIEDHHQKRTRFKTIVQQHPFNTEILSKSNRGKSPEGSPREVPQDISSSLPTTSHMKRSPIAPPTKWRSTFIHRNSTERTEDAVDIILDETTERSKSPDVHSMIKKDKLLSFLKDLPSHNNMTTIPKLAPSNLPRYKAIVEKGIVVEEEKSSKGTLFGPKGHVVYTIRVTKGEECWNVKRRYNDFLHFHQKLTQLYPDAKSLPYLTGKMVFGNFKDDAILKRKGKLNQYLNELLEVNDLPIKLLDDFLMQDQQVRIDSFKDIAMQAFKSLGGTEGKIPVENLNKIKDLAPKLNLDEIFHKNKELSFEEFYQILDHQDEKIEEIEEVEFCLSNVRVMEKFNMSGIFGQSLDDLIKNRKIDIVIRILKFLQNQDVDFDQKCNEIVILKYQHMINSGVVRFEEVNSIVLGIMIKRFLLSLPQCLLSGKYFLQFMTKPVHERDHLSILDNIEKLPKQNKEFVVSLISFFRKIIFEQNISLDEISTLFAHVFIRDEEIKNENSQFFVERLLTLPLATPDDENDWSISFSPLYGHQKRKPRIKIEYAPETPWVYYQPCHESKNLSTVTDRLLEYLPYIVEESDDVIIYDKKDCKAITIEKLLFKLTEDTKFHKTLLLTYRNLMSGCELMRKLIFLYNLPPYGEDSFSHFLNFVLLPLRLKISQFLSMWICNFFADFREEPKLRLLLDEFCLMISATKMDAVAQSLRRHLASHIKKRATFLSQQVKDIVSQTVYKSFMSVSPPDGPEKPQQNGLIEMKTISIVDVLKFKSHDIANQLTLMTLQNFNNIRSKEFLNSAWTKEGKETNSPNIVHMIKTSNMISLWVATEIVTTPIIRDRLMKIMKFIKAAVYCRKLNNYNNVMDIYAGLNISCVYRLKKTWALLPVNAQIEWKEIETLMDPSGSFKLLRQEQYRKLPCIPYIGMYCTDLMFIEDGNKDVLKSGLLNWAKRNLQAKVIDEIQTYQKSVYHIENELEIMKRLYGLEVLDQKELDRISLEMEPREKN
jgi:hypothetical protein